MVGAISNEGLSEQLRFTNIFKGTRSSFRCTRVSGTSISSGPGGPMSVCYHRGVREQWYLYRKYLKLTLRDFLCASKEKGHAVSDEALWSVDRAISLSSLKKKLRRSRSLVGIWGHPQSREVDNHPDRAGSGDRGRTSSEEVGMRHRLLFNNNILEPISPLRVCTAPSGPMPFGWT
jgi:hypothetical protein